MSSETLARAANSVDLAFEPNVVHDVDRVAAMAGGNALGGLLFRFAEAQQPRWGYQIALILANRAMKRHAIGRELAQKIGAAALLEFASPHCVTCNGARELVLDELKVICEACGGSGKQRYSNTSRRALVGTYGKRIDDAFADCHNDMANALGAFVGHANGRLQ